MAGELLQEVQEGGPVEVGMVDLAKILRRIRAPIAMIDPY